MARERTRHLLLDSRESNLRMTAKANSIIPAERIQQCIYLVRQQKVMLDSDLARLYGVETKALVRAVKRNSDRFPGDFMFQLTTAEYEAFLRCQFGTSKRGSGGRRYLPYAFTEPRRTDNRLPTTAFLVTRPLSLFPCVPGTHRP